MKIYIFNLIRAAACLLVVIAHLFIPNSVTSEIEKYYFAPGQIGVGMFFFISGYLIIKSLEKESLKSFATRRFWRIYPVFIVISVAALVIYSYFGYSRSCSNNINSKDVLAQLFLISDFVGTCNLMSAQWTLFIEIKFYILAAVAIYFAKDDVIKFLKIFYGSLIVFYSAFVFNHNLHEIIAARTGGGVMFISLGMLFYLYQSKKITLSLWRNLSCAVAALGVLMFINFEKFYLSNVNLLCAFSYLVGFLISYLLISRKGDFKQNSVVNFFANISYPLYLSHQTFGMVAEEDGYLLERLCLFVAILIFSYVVHKLVEQPLINYSKKSYETFSNLRPTILIHSKAS